MYDPRVGWIKGASWWNGERGQAQRRIYLWTDGTQWGIEARQGPSGGNVPRPSWRRRCRTEAEARELAAEMRARTSGDAWREMPIAWPE